MARPAERIDLLNELQEDDQPIISPRRYSELLRIELQQLADQAHVHRNTVGQRPHSAQLQQYLREATRVLTAIVDVNGNIKQSVYWFRNQPLEPFDYKTPETLVSEGKTEKVLKYIAMLAAGPTG